MAVDEANHSPVTIENNKNCIHILLKSGYFDYSLMTVTKEITNNVTSIAEMPMLFSGTSKISTNTSAKTPPSTTTEHSQFLYEYKKN